MIVAENAKFTYPEVKVGFSGGLITNLVTRIPHKIAMEMLLLGDTDRRQARLRGRLRQQDRAGRELIRRRWTMQTGSPR